MASKKGKGRGPGPWDHDAARAELEKMDKITPLEAVTLSTEIKVIHNILSSVRASGGKYFTLDERKKLADTEDLLLDLQQRLGKHFFIMKDHT